MYYVTYNPTGKLTGGFNQNLQQDHSANFIEVSPDQANNWVMYHANPERSKVELNPPVVQPILVPTFVSMGQARLALLAAGLLSTANNIIASIPGTEGEKARIKWEFSNIVARNEDLVVQLITALNLSPTQADALFIEANNL